MQRSIFTERNYLTYLCGSIFSTQGIWIQRMTLGWMMWDQTHSESWLGMLAFLMFFPSVIIGPLFGVMVDRINRRQAAVVTSIILGLLSLLLSLLIWQQLADEMMLLFFALGIGIANSAYQSIRLSLVPELVSAVNMPKAVAINAILYNTSRFIGPVIAGLLIKYQGNAVAFAVVAACYIPLIIVLLLLKLDESQRTAEAKQFTFFMDIKAGLNYALRSDLILRLLMLIAVSAMFGRGLLEILPAAVDVLYGRGVEALAWMNSAAGIGAIIAGLLLSSFSAGRLLPAMRIAVISSGLLLVVFSYTRSFELGLVIIGGLSFCATVCGVGTQSLIQVSVTSAFRGRVMSLWGAINIGGGALGGLLFGVFTESVGYPFTLITMGLICVVIAYVATRRIRLPVTFNQPKCD
ncbi:MFS transporter [Colwellia psychrerythraea]|uniref:Putative membrane protein n=1 Tax=Colwellia psychrerythraea (strain 34H / ATCC BAA-681) TaxID=167879 RepID=Q486E8_COLP3|nr:MFS transporter [Colwellia psychrerythraea]AAZ24231.1 putative membrane protein [Colwellia psychrerythraea 34H]